MNLATLAMNHSPKHPANRELDSITLPDYPSNAKYWSRGAEGAMQALVKLIGDEAYDLVAPIWHCGRTWQEICIDVEAQLDYRRQLAEKATRK